MSNPKSIELVLSCASWQEAQTIADALLDKRLIACAEFMEVKSKYRWDDKLEEASEVKLIMETVAGNFEKIEAEVARLHSYDTFVLYAVPIAHISESSAKWLEGQL
ncbi:MAG TPA: divalent-cation tolerance protein CutA [Candidatus Saccharimonadales bacterium]|nr:divalent-cation tolerance protein CutA [Candidatus Saccharimonadales bacterium]